ncbi:hypothetical protein HPB48_008725 [Haemaphysalis longicornis]|uniref:Uncharacterized protein n=1 Tax=Haemaphysalis longicornis TaxID=44386 RepID=A0A9J6GIC2_HAELO|nr:hypothetical protein HPB48_008725 [Haemaphysalis longicornis]
MLSCDGAVFCSFVLYARPPSRYRLTSWLCEFVLTKSQAIRARDERLKATSDLLSTIRVVKMYAWEEAMQENVLCARETELKWLFRINLLDAVLDSVYSSTSSVVRCSVLSSSGVQESCCWDCRWLLSHAGTRNPLAAEGASTADDANRPCPSHGAVQARIAPSSCHVISA